MNKKKCNYILFLTICLFGCFARQELRQPDIVEQISIVKPPIGAIPLEWNGGEEAILYEMTIYDSIKFKVIVDSGVSSFLFDSTYFAKLGFGCDNRNVFITRSPFGGKINTYLPSKKLDISPFSALNSFQIRMLNLSKLEIDTTDIKGLIPLTAFSQEIIQINLKDRYILPLDSVIDDSYIKLPIEVDLRISHTPIVTLNMQIIKDGVPFYIDGKFQVDYGYMGYIGINYKKMDDQLFSQRRDTVTVSFNGITKDSIQIDMEPVIDEYAGFLGVQFLAMFDVIIDYKEKYLYLKSNI